MGAKLVDEEHLRHPRVIIRTPRLLASGGAAALREWVARVEAAGIDGVFCGDHVSFHDGRGFDALIDATALAVLSERLTIWSAVYLLALRHAVPVARQVASLAGLAPGRFMFGVGLGGEDPHELEICGVDPRRRGRRLDAHLDAVRALLAGDEVSIDNEFLSIPGALIRPAPQPRVPILVGGRSTAALARTGRAADGWIAIWVSPARAEAALSTIAEHAERYGRAHPPNRHAMTVWCGLGDTASQARSLVAPVMENLYKTPFDKFERYTPCGTPAEVAEAIAPFVELGFHDIMLNGVAQDDATLIALSKEVGQHLSAA
ncbi:LLM class flavin-dependent oxidoreductase [Mycolicibacterium sp.]|uniref:LLM class flavin-dependent oxidoreductase n=1 Tax=Mycolicibacterium sp. TaxID=2320850 RepID=UPI001A3110EC|nr:LLM class flavin-dependent oxidoreductase [Mycolicibacterium sp.]MBJ7336759.1 LLM class flavin-dependent oxidoreductase [Mycolicibacterium sp.]